MTTFEKKLISLSPRGVGPIQFKPKDCNDKGSKTVVRLTGR